jgi:hypothetical protein
MRTLTEQQYQEDCTKYFAPLDEIAEALSNGEGINGLTYKELNMMVQSNENLKLDLEIYL